MSLHILIDVRRIHDFGIGTYIRSLVQALGEVDLRNHYTLVISPSELRELPALPTNFEVATYSRRDDDAADHIAFPAFLRQIPADLFHIPLNRVNLPQISGEGDVIGGGVVPSAERGDFKI